MPEHQLSLLDAPRVRRHDPASSHVAADRLERSGALTRQAAAVLAAVVRWPGRWARGKALAAASGPEHLDLAAWVDRKGRS